jgi:hypothetical protein
MQALADAYDNAEHWSIRRQILAIVVADFPNKLIKQYFPNVTRWKMQAARSHARFNGMLELSWLNIHHYVTIPCRAGCREQH